MPAFKTGFFGKLPAHGDFIYRDLPTSFINSWDGWLQGFVKSSQEQLGDAWLDVYLTSPIWRFALSEGVIDEHLWCGISLPSVDRVGRYFPFTLVARLPASAGAATINVTQSDWFDELEAIALRALDGQLVIDNLVEEINELNVSLRPGLVGRASAIKNANAVMSLNEDCSSNLHAMPVLLDTCLTQNLQSYSVWSTKGSNFVEPCTFYTKSLPPLGGIAAMLDGRWAEWQWQPFMLSQSNGRVDV